MCFKLKKFLSIILIIGAINYFYNVSFCEDNNLVILSIKSEIDGLTEGEGFLLEELFVLTQEIEKLNRYESLLNESISERLINIQKLEEKAQVENLKQKKYLESLSKTLKVYQMNGANSYIEIIFSSTSIKDVIKKLNILKDFSSNTKKLVDVIEESKSNLEKLKIEQNEEMKKLKDSKLELEATISEKLEVRINLENKLINLKGERIKFEEYLSEINERWLNSSTIFRNELTKLSSTIQKGDIPIDILRLRFTSVGIKGSISEEAFNKILKASTDENKLEMIFNDDEIIIKMPLQNLEIFGTFELIDEEKLDFIPKSGKFLGLELELESTKELLIDEELSIDFKPLLNSYKIKSLSIIKGYIELLIKLK